MARIRTVKPDFWKSESIAALPFRTRLTFIGLWTYVDDNGVGLDSYKLIAAELFGLEDDPREARANVREDLARLHSAGRITRYTVGSKRYFAVVNWDEHQKIDKPGRPRYPGPGNEDAAPLTREEAWQMDGPPAIPGQDSRDSRETLAPGVGNREEGVGNRDKGIPPEADTADAVSSAQGEFPGMPATQANLPVRREDAAVAEVVINGGNVSAAYIDGAVAAGLDKPSGALIARVGKAAKQMLGEHKDPRILLDAAFEMGGSEYNDLGVAYRKLDARLKGRGRYDNDQGRGGSDLARRSTAAQRAEQALDVADQLDREYANGATS
jgi:hypothetical protein